MSSDDETPSLSEKEKLTNEGCSQSMHSSTSSGLRQRFRITSRQSTSKEGSLAVEFLENLQKINDGIFTQDSTEIESGVDVLADMNISNFEVDDENVLNINEIAGSEIRSSELCGRDENRVTFGPVGFVDLRVPQKKPTLLDTIYRYCKQMSISPLMFKRERLCV